MTGSMPLTSICQPLGTSFSSLTNFHVILSSVPEGTLKLALAKPSVTRTLHTGMTAGVGSFAPQTVHLPSAHWWGSVCFSPQSQLRLCVLSSSAAQAPKLCSWGFSVLPASSHASTGKPPLGSAANAAPSVAAKAGSFSSASVLATPVLTMFVAEVVSRK